VSISSQAPKHTMADEEQEEKMLESVSEMVTSLNEQVSQLQSWLKCRHMKISPDDREQLEQINERITNLESTVSAMDEQISREEDSIVFIERMSEAVELHNNKIDAMINHLPEQLPIISDRYKTPSITLSTIMQYVDRQRSPHHQQSFQGNSSFSEPHSGTNHKHGQHRSSPPQHNQEGPRRAVKRKAAGNGGPRATKRRKVNEESQREIPQIEIVGKDEFDSVPKYVRGRLSQNRLNDSINEFNQHLMAKYRILQMAPSKMPKGQYDLFEKYQKEETKETKRLFWLGQDDFRNSRNFTFDQTGKAAFNVMRHLKRIKMISGKKPKYSVL